MIANDAPASTQPIAFASSPTAWRYLKISVAIACIVASESPPANSVMANAAGMFRVVTLILAEATSIVDAAIAKARQLDVNVSVAVCDELGRLIAFKCMDGAPAEADRASIGKAIASAGTGLPSGEVEGAVDYTLVGTVIGEGRSAICVRGGLPIFRNGKIEGACGVAGVLSHEKEEECACAGIASILR